MNRRREWPPTPVFLPGESHGQRTLAGYIQSMESQRVWHDWANWTITSSHSRVSAENKPKFLTFLLQILKWCPVAFEITSSIYRPCRNQPLPGITLSSFPTLQSHWLVFCSVNIFLHQSRHWGASLCLQNSSISHLANPKCFFLTEALSDSWCRSTLSVESSLSTRPVSEHI